MSDFGDPSVLPPLDSFEGAVAAPNVPLPPVSDAQTYAPTFNYQPSEQLQNLYQQAAQPLPDVVSQYESPQGADFTSGLYDTSGNTAPSSQGQGGIGGLLKGLGISGGDALKLALGVGGGLMGYSAQQKATSDASAAAQQYQQAAQTAAQQITGGSQAAQQQYLQQAQNAAQQLQAASQQAQQQYIQAGQQAAQQYKDVAAPYITAGAPQLAMALQGALSPAQMQQYQAAQARLAQAAEKTGGVGAVQEQQGLQQIYNTALQNQQNMALQLLGPANSLMSQAIATELSGQQGGVGLGLQGAQQAATTLLAGSNLGTQTGLSGLLSAAQMGFEGTTGGLNLEMSLVSQANQASMNLYSAIGQMLGGTKSTPAATGATS